MKDKKRITKGIFINRISGRKEDGYLSIEAGLLLPFLMMVTTLLFYMEIYAYDRALLTNDCNLLCAKILENVSLDKEEITDKLAELSALIKKEHPYLSASGFSMNVEHKATASTGGGDFGAGRHHRPERFGAGKGIRRCCGSYRYYFDKDGWNCKGWNCHCNFRRA